MKGEHEVLITDLDLGTNRVRILNALLRGPHNPYSPGLATLDELCTLSAKDLTRVRHLGSKSVATIRTALAKHKRFLRGEVPEIPAKSEIRAKRVERELDLDSPSPLIEGTRRDDIKNACSGIEENLRTIERALLDSSNRQNLQIYFREIVAWAEVALDNLKP